MIDFKKNFKLKSTILENFSKLTNEKKEMVRDWRNNESIRKWMYTNQIISKKEHFEFIEKLKNDDKNYYWLVKSKSEKYMGVIYLNRVDFINKNAYLGIYKNPECRLPGVGCTLIESLKELVFKIAKLHTLKLEVIEDNERAINFYKKFGFIEEERLKEFVLKENTWKDVIVMGIIDKE